MVKDYLTWLEPSLNRVYLVFSDRLGVPPLGIVFRRNQSGGNVGPVMCEWCHSIRPGDHIGLLTVTKNHKKRVGLNLCRDLGCKNRIAEVPGVNDPTETLDSHEKIRRILLRMGEFARHELF